MSESKLKDNIHDSGLEEISLRELIMKGRSVFKYLFSCWKLIFVFGIVGAIIGFGYALTRKPIYSAVTSFVLEEAGGGSNMGQYAGIASMLGVDIAGGGGGIFQGDNLLELYRSHSILKKALFSEINFEGTKHLLIDVYLTVNNTKANWENSILKDIHFTPKDVSEGDRLKDSIVLKIVEDIRDNYLYVGKKDKKLGIIQVEVKSFNEEFSKILNEQIVRTVNDFFINTKSKKSLENISILQRQTDSVRNVLNGAIYESAATADATPNLNQTRQILRTPAQRSQINAEANKAILTQLVQNLELAKISLRRETPLIQIIDSPVLPLPKQQLGPRKAAAIGFVLFAFLTTSFLIIKFILKDILSGGQN